MIRRPSTRCLASLLAPAALAAVGCFDAAGDCARNPNLPCYGSGGDSGAGGTTSSGGAGGSSSSVSAPCDPTDPGFASAEQCAGVFVRPGATGGDGSPSAPFGSIGEVLGAGPTEVTIFVCNAENGLDERATFLGATRLVGGLDCSDWSRSTSRTPWTATSGGTPLRFESPSGALVAGFEVTAQDAIGTDPEGNGANSVAIAVSGPGTITLFDSAFSAGRGADGANGSALPGSAPGAELYPSDFAGTSGLGCGASNGGSQRIYMCPDGSVTIGGGGGAGTLSSVNSQPGIAGSPDLGMGQAGVGDTGSGWSCQSQGFGRPGANGPAGADGVPGEGLGTLSGAGEYVGARGGDGEPGQIGQGGGGAGGRRGASPVCTTSTTGPGGGGGGAGGCGGAMGGGGGAGGASFALVSVGATVTLEGVELRASEGGRGGDGGLGQLGGGGGAPGAGGAGNGPSYNGCTGGLGGSGGNGGGGGGGRGGPSVAVAYTGAAPSLDDGSTTAVGAAAASGGDGGSPGNPGLPGLLTASQKFD
jgi:hypothetical protein